MSRDGSNDFSGLANSLLPPSNAFRPQQWSQNMTYPDYGNHFEQGGQSASSAFLASSSLNNLQKSAAPHLTYDAMEYENSEGAVNSNGYSEPASATQSEPGQFQAFQVGSRNARCILLTQDAANECHCKRH